MSAQIINTELYPLDHLGSSDGQALLDQVRSRLQQNGSCTLPDFVAADVLQKMAAQASSIAHLAYPGPTEVSPYFFNYRLGEGETLADTHPLRRKGKRQLAQVATDLIPAYSNTPPPSGSCNSSVVTMLPLSKCHCWQPPSSITDMFND